MSGSLAGGAAHPGERLPGLLVRAAFFLFVLSIPFEFPDRDFPVEIPTIAAGLFLLATLLEPRRCYGRVPAALLAFGAYLYAFWLAATLAGRAPFSTELYTPDYWSQVVKLFVQELEAVLVFWAGLNVMRSQQVARTALLVLAVGCLIEAALPLLGVARTARPQWGGGYRVAALGQNPDHNADVLAAGLVALLGLRYGMREQLQRARWLVWPAMGAIIVSLVGTGSRAGFLSLVLGLTVLMVTGARSGWAWVRTAMVMILAIAGLVYTAYSNDLMRRRLDEAMEGRFTRREHLFPTLVQMWRERPVVGWGPVNNKYELGIREDERVRRRRDAHNVVLEVLTATGVVGAIPFFTGLGLCVLGAWRARRGAHGYVPLALCVSLLMANMSGNLIASLLFWLVLAYAAAAQLREREATGLAPPADETLRPAAGAPLATRSVPAN